MEVGRGGGEGEGRGVEGKKGGIRTDEGFGETYLSIK